MNYLENPATLVRFRTSAPGTFGRLPYRSFIESLAAFVAAEPIQYCPVSDPYEALRQRNERIMVNPETELGLAFYSQEPATYLVNGDRCRLDVQPLKRARGEPDRLLHTHSGPGSLYPSVDHDLRYFEKAGCMDRLHFILSRLRGYQLTRYRHPFSGSGEDYTIRWPAQHRPLLVRTVFDLDDMPRQERFPLQGPHVVSQGGMNVIEVLPLDLVAGLQKQYGDAVFADPALDWYTEGLRMS